MAIMILNLFLILIETFFWNRIIISLILFIQSIRRKKLWAMILVTVADGLLLWLYCIENLVNADSYVTPELSKAAVITFSLLSGAIILFMYVQTILTIAPSVRFKSRRQRAFQRSVAGKEKNYALPIVVSIVGLIAGIISLIYYKVNYTSDYKGYITLSIAIISVSAVILIYTIVSIIISRKTLKNQDDSNVITIKAESVLPHESTVVFILEVDGAHEFYRSRVKGEIKFQELLGTIAEYYYISSYGILKDNGEEYKLYGLKTSSFDVDLYSQIKMDRFESSKLESILPYLEKNHRKIFTLDENNNPINSFDA